MGLSTAAWQSHHESAQKINEQTVQSFEDIKEEIRLKLAQEKAEDDLVVLSENIYDRLSGEAHWKPYLRATSSYSG